MIYREDDRRRSPGDAPRDLTDVGPSGKVGDVNSSLGVEAEARRCACGCGAVITAGSRFVRGHNQRRWQRERILGAIQAWTSEAGSPPTCASWDHAGVDRDKYPTSHAVTRFFGSWNAALLAADVLPNRRQRWPAERVVAAIQQWTAEYGCPPTCAAWDRATAGRYPSRSTVTQTFGSWRVALVAAGVLVLPREGWRTLDPAFGHWLAGLIDGEGSFKIDCGARPAAQLAISLRDDDTAVLKDIQLQLGLGRVYHIIRRGNAKPQSVWAVGARAETQAMVEVLDRYPLRSKKLRAYGLWRQAVAFLATLPRGSRDWARIVGLKQQLSSVHAYQPPSLS
jgi:LAGLIDADG endonuclease/Homing endonuclease associated repeat